MKIFLRNLGHLLAFPFVAISLLIGLARSKRLHKLYISDNENLTINDRYNYVYKQSNKAVFIANCDIEYEGIEKIPNTPVMYVCNHKAGFDPLLLLKIFSENNEIIKPVFVSKIELLENRNIGNAAKLIDTIFIDRKNLRSAIKCLNEEKKVLTNKSIVVFIEGTRIKTKEFGEFKGAALEPAMTMLRPIVPVVIHGSLGVEQENKKGYFKYKKINVRFLDPIKPKQYVNATRDGIAEKLKKIMYQEYELLDKNSKEN